MQWTGNTEDKFRAMIAKVPSPMRQMAENMVTKKVGELLEKEGRETVDEKDLVDAFFDVTPFGFHGPMKTDMEELGIDYTQYGYER